ncbi:MAG: hypothetical protein ACE5FN_09995 [Leptospirillia bacterium]
MTAQPLLLETLITQARKQWEMRGEEFLMDPHNTEKAKAVMRARREYDAALYKTQRLHPAGKAKSA